jgi:hypothetical protein
MESASLAVARKPETAMKPFAEIVDPFDLTAREWIIDLEPLAIHSIARRRLYIRGLPSGSYFPAGRCQTSLLKQPERLP